MNQVSAYTNQFVPSIKRHCNACGDHGFAFMCNTNKHNGNQRPTPDESHSFLSEVLTTIEVITDPYYASIDNVVISSLSMYYIDN